jgi:hypothetical protein
VNGEKKRPTRICRIAAVVNQKTKRVEVYVTDSRGRLWWAAEPERQRRPEWKRVRGPAVIEDSLDTGAI